MSEPQKLCTRCHSVGTPRSARAAFLAVAFALLIVSLVGVKLFWIGGLYLVAFARPARRVALGLAWWRAARCAACGETRLIPLDAPAAQRLRAPPTSPPT